MPSPSLASTPLSFFVTLQVWRLLVLVAQHSTAAVLLLLVVVGLASSCKSDTAEGWPDKVVGVAVCAGEMRPSVDISVEGTQVAVSLR